MEERKGGRERAWREWGATEVRENGEKVLTKNKETRCGWGEGTGKGEEEERKRITSHSTCWVSGLDHKLLNNTMEDMFIVVTILRMNTEVFNSLGTT